MYNIFCRCQFCMFLFHYTKLFQKVWSFLSVHVNRMKLPVQPTKKLVLYKYSFRGNYNKALTFPLPLSPPLHQSQMCSCYRPVYDYTHALTSLTDSACLDHSQFILMIRKCSFLFPQMVEFAPRLH